MFKLPIKKVELQMLKLSKKRKKKKVQQMLKLVLILMSTMSVINSYLVMTGNSQWPFLCFRASFYIYPVCIVGAV